MKQGQRIGTETVDVNLGVWTLGLRDFTLGTSNDTPLVCLEMKEIDHDDPLA